MEIKAGDNITIYTDTDVESYLRYIRHYLQFKAEIKGGYIVIGEPKKTYNPTNYSKQIMEARKKKKMSRKELADLCGVKEDAVFNWEMHGIIPKNWKKVQKILGI